MAPGDTLIARPDSSTAKVVQPAGQSAETIYYYRIEDVTPQQAALPDTTLFSPDPVKAVWYSALCPGLGQIYNRSYWKLPILVGG